MRAIIAGVACALATSLAAAAPASAQSIEELLTVTKARGLVEGATANMETAIRQGMTASMGSAPLTEEQKRMLDALPPKLVAAMRPEFSWDALKPDFVRIYSETFSEEEVAGLIEFYKSPLGQAVIAKMPIVLNKSVQFTQARMAGVMPKLQAAVIEALGEFKAKKD